MNTRKILAFAVASYSQAILIEMLLGISLHQELVLWAKAYLRKYGTHTPCVI